MTMILVIVFANYADMHGSSTLIRACMIIQKCSLNHCLKFAWKIYLPWWHFDKLWNSEKKSQKVACPDKNWLALGHRTSWNFKHWPWLNDLYNVNCVSHRCTQVPTQRSKHLSLAKHMTWWWVCVRGIRGRTIFWL